MRTIIEERYYLTKLFLSPRILLQSVRYNVEGVFSCVLPVCVFYNTILSNLYTGCSLNPEWITVEHEINGKPLKQ